MLDIIIFKKRFSQRSQSRREKKFKLTALRSQRALRDKKALSKK